MHTRQGLHLNKHGKSKLANEIYKTVLAAASVKRSINLVFESDEGVSDMNKEDDSLGANQSVHQENTCINGKVNPSVLIKDNLNRPL